MYEEFLVSLTKNPHLRRSDDVAIIKKNIKKIEFFQEQFKGEDHSFDLLSKLFRLECFIKGEEIFRIGSKGEKYYFIVEGMVEIENDKNNTEDNQQQRRKASEFQENRNNKQKILLQGEGFGQQVLITNVIRSYKAISAAQTALAVLTRKDFRSVLKQGQNRKVKNEIQFFKGIYLFDSWTDDMLRDMNQKSVLQEIPHEKCVYKEGDQIDGVFLIKSGVFEMRKHMDIPTETQLGEFPKSPLYFSAKIGQIGEKDMFGEEDFLEITQRIDREDKIKYDANEGEEFEESASETNFSSHKKKKKKNDIFQFKKRREYEVKCISIGGGQVIKIDGQEFIDKILFYKQTRELAINAMKKKVERHKEQNTMNQDTLGQYKHFLKQGETWKKWQEYYCFSYARKNSLSQLQLEEKDGISNSLREVLALENKDLQFKGWRGREAKELKSRVSNNQISENKSSVDGTSLNGQGPNIEFLFSQSVDEEWKKDQLRMSMYKFDKARLEEASQTKIKRLMAIGIIKDTQEHKEVIKNQNKNSIHSFQSTERQPSFLKLIKRCKSRNGPSPTSPISLDSYSDSQSSYQVESRLTNRYQTGPSNSNFMPYPQNPKRNQVYVLNKLDFNCFYSKDLPNPSFLNNISTQNSRRSSILSPNNYHKKLRSKQTNLTNNFKVHERKIENQKEINQIPNITQSDISQSKRTRSNYSQGRALRYKDDAEKIMLEKERQESEEKNLSAIRLDGPIRIAEAYKSSPDSVNRLFHYLEKQRKSVQGRKFVQKEQTSLSFISKSTEKQKASEQIEKQK